MQRLEERSERPVAVRLEVFMLQTTDVTWDFTSTANFATTNTTITATSVREKDRDAVDNIFLVLLK